MAYPVTVLACLAALVAVCWSKIPDGYVLQVAPSCGPLSEDDASIEIITDLNAEAKAVCAGGITVDFTTDDGVNFNLSVSYPNQGSQRCIFKQRANTLVFSIKVVVSYGEVGSLVHQNEEEYTVSCTFHPKGVDRSRDQNVVEGLIAPNELQINMGTDSLSTFTLGLVDVLGDSLADTDVHTGRTVMLRAVTSGVEGLRPVSCDAIDGSARYSILRAGCGDGLIFSKDAGFITSGNTTTSPYFPAFSINAATVINFECNFISCTLDTCDGEGGFFYTISTCLCSRVYCHTMCYSLPADELRCVPNDPTNWYLGSCSIQ